MDKLLIYTAGSGSREVLLAVEQLNQQRPTWEVLGFVDKSPKLAGTVVDGFPVWDPDRRPQGPSVYGVCGVMDPKVRQRMIEQFIEGAGQKLATIIHPSVAVPRDCKIGPGTILMPGVRVSFNVKLGKGVLVLWNVLLGHDLRVDDYATILSGATITGGCSIGARSTLGAGSTLNIKVAIGEDSLVGVGTTVFAAIPARKTVVAMPRLLVKDR